MHPIRYFLACYLLFLFVGAAPIASAQDKKETEIKLVLQITVDGLRADRLSRYEDRFGDGGFNYLLKNGTVFTNAHYQHANTETIVGHTVLATGAFPSENGMIGNVWFDSESKELSYNIEDQEAPILPTRDKEVKGEQVDPAQKLSRAKGRSPRAILAATFSDGLAVFSNGKSKIFGISGKDRGAVPMAGHTGKAFWFSTDSGDFVTSSYYYDTYPGWVKRWNELGNTQKHAGSSWNLLHETGSYIYKDDRPYETDLKGFSRVFPHPFGEVEDKLFNTKILVSPVGDRLLCDFAKELVKAEKIGIDDTPDYLSISFSAVDAVNHFFGPSSRENEDVVLHLDRILADLFTFVGDTIGLEHTLIILSADHGMAEMPEYLTELGYEVGRLSTDGIVNVANEAGLEKFGIDEIVRFFFRPYIYLNDEKIAAAKLNQETAEKAIASALTNIRGVAYAVTQSGLPELQKSPILQQIRRNTHGSRSGDIYVAQDPYWFLFDKGPVAVMHGSPWRYDTHVPLIFVGPSIQPQTINRPVHPVDVAPTMAAFLGISPPSSASGVLLFEILQ